MKLTSLLLISIAAFAQMQDNRKPKLNCDNNNNGRSNQSRFCRMAEQTLASVGRLQVDAGQNGGVSIRGWSRADVLVRARVEAWAPSDSEASLLAGQIHTDAAGGQVRASGPEMRDQRGWSVSYEIFAPHATALTLAAVNGGIHISDIEGRLEFRTTNGGIHLTRVGGDISGATQNGGVHVALAGPRWNGSQLEVRTQNGGVHLSVPENLSARVQAETVNGGIHSDFPLPLRAGERRPRTLEFNIGSGGPLIHLTTVNGGVHVSRL